MLYVTERSVRMSLLLEQKLLEASVVDIRASSSRRSERAEEKVAVVVVVS